MKTARPIALLGLVLVTCAPTRRSVGPDRATAQVLAQVRSEHAIPGMGAAIVEGGRVTIAVSGQRRADRDAPLVRSDAFHLGSDTKAITASAVARLVDRGVLRWDETIPQALPALADRIDQAFRAVTLDMLMRHLAGLPEGGAFTPEFTAGFDEGWPIERQRAWMTERFLTRPAAIPPGTRFAYSNYGYLVLGHILEQATGKPWEQVVAEEVFSPLEMTGCGFGSTATPERPDDSWGHDLRGGVYLPVIDDNPQLIGPAGGVTCPLDAWARFAAVHAGAVASRWLSPAAMAHLHEGKTLDGVANDKDIALGWGVTRTEPPRLTHSGSNGYNDAEIVVIPRLRAAVLVTCNAGDERARAAGRQLAAILVERLLEP
jgi:CubicO group peptidase (beta-lactamase class C family)